MDNIIQSQSQSAIVQKLSETEHNLKRFTKEIPDNAPIMSHQTVELNPYIGDVSEQSGTCRFRVPRRGYLNRMWLKVRAEATKHKPRYISDKGRGCEKFMNFFESASLFVGGKRVETLYGESIIYNSTTHHWDIAHHLVKGLTGMNHNEASGPPGFEFGKPNNYSVDLGSGNGILPHRNADYIIPLEFSMFRFFKDSMDTNFLGEIEIEFVKKHMIGQQLPGDRVYSSLVCKYHNFLNHFRTNVRNANFSKETSSFLLTNSVKITEIPTLEEETISPSGIQIGTFTYQLQSLKDVTDILIAFRQEEIDNNAYHGEFSRGWGYEGRFSLKLKANGTTLIDKKGAELIYPDLNIHSQDVPDLVKPEVVRVSMGNYAIEAHAYHSGTGPYDTATQTHFFRLEHKTTPIVIVPLKMFGTDEFYAGGINTESLTNVELILSSTSFATPGTLYGNDFTHCTPSVVLRTKTVGRIDTKTGTVAV